MWLCVNTSTMLLTEFSYFCSFPQRSTRVSATHGTPAQVLLLRSVLRHTQPLVFLQLRLHRSLRLACVQRYHLVGRHRYMSQLPRAGGASRHLQYVPSQISATTRWSVRLLRKLSRRDTHDDVTAADIPRLDVASTMVNDRRLCVGVVDAVWTVWIRLPAGDQQLSVVLAGAVHGATSTASVGRAYVRRAALDTAACPVRAACFLDEAILLPAHPARRPQGGSKRQRWWDGATVPDVRWSRRLAETRDHRWMRHDGSADGYDEHRRVTDRLSRRARCTVHQVGREWRGPYGHHGGHIVLHSRLADGADEDAIRAASVSPVQERLSTSNSHAEFHPRHDLPAVAEPECVAEHVNESTRSRAVRMCVPTRHAVGVLVLSVGRARDEHVAPRRQCFLCRDRHQGDHISRALLAVYDRHVHWYDVGATGRLHLLRQVDGKHHRIPIRHIPLRQRHVDHAVRGGRCDPCRHDVHPRLLQHLDAGEGRLEGVHPATDSIAQDQRVAAGDARTDQAIQRRVLYMLPSHAHGSRDALQTFLPRHVSAEVALRAGTLSRVPNGCHANVRDEPWW